MAKLKDSDKPATKQDLDDLSRELRGEIQGNRRGIDELKDTTAELKKADERIIKGIISLGERLDKRCDDLQVQINEKFDKIMTGQDKVIGELKAIREEITATSDLYKKHDKKLENHEERIGRLEEQKLA